MRDGPVARIESDLSVTTMKWDGSDSIVLTAEGQPPYYLNTHAGRLRRYCPDAVQHISVSLPTMNIRTHSGLRLKITVEVIAEVADED